MATWLKESWINHVDHDPEFINREIIEKSDLKNYFKDCFNGSGKSFAILAKEGEKYAGVLKVNIEKIEKFFNETKILFLDDLYVEESFRGKGVSAKLIEAAEKLAKEKKIKWTKARVYEFNIPAQKVFDKNGFKKLYSEYFKIIK